MRSDNGGDAHADSDRVVLTATRTVAPGEQISWTILSRSGLFYRAAKTTRDHDDRPDEISSVPFNTWQEAVATDLDLTLLREDMPTEFDLEVSDDQLALASLLRFESEQDHGSDGWPDDVGRIGEYRIYFLLRPDTKGPRRNTVGDG